MFTLKIKTDNAAFGDGAGQELASILRALALRLDMTDSDRIYHGTCRDSNGNPVGEYKLTSR